MDLTELINISRVNNVIVQSPFNIPARYDLGITGHHMILSSEYEKPTEITVNTIDFNLFCILMHFAAQILHRSIDRIVKRPYSLNDGGSLIIKFKDLKQFKIDITGESEFWNVADSLEKLSAAGNSILYS